MEDRKLTILQLILPVLIPSWRFFDIIKPAPRIEYRLISGADADEWCAFRPAPSAMPLPRKFLHLLYSPWQNDTLFARSCAERIICGQIEHSSTMMARLIAADLNKADENAHFQFRLVFTSRDGADLRDDVLYISGEYDEVGGAI